MCEDLGGLRLTAAARRECVDRFRLGFERLLCECCSSRQHEATRLDAIAGHVLEEKAMLTLWPFEN